MNSNLGNFIVHNNLKLQGGKFNFDQQGILGAKQLLLGSAKDLPISLSGEKLQLYGKDLLANNVEFFGDELYLETQHFAERG